MKKELIFNLWDSHKNYLGKQSTELKNINFSELVGNLFCPGNYFYYVIDSPTLTYDFVSDSVEDIIGISPHELSIDKIIEYLHPDDLNWLIRCEDVVAYFLKNQIQPEDVVNYKICYCIRLKVKDGSYRLFLMQTMTLKTTEDGALLKVFGCITDINHITSVNNKKLSLIGLNGKASYLELDVLNDQPFEDFKPFMSFEKEFPYTKRELEVIKLIGEGFSSSNIAEILTISEKTVLTHRKNILTKSEFKNTTELVANCIRKGYI
jgi:DNA-binding CsgD family transcriptional regulator